MKRMVRLLKLTLAAMLAAAFFAGCGSFTAPEPSPADPAPSGTASENNADHEANNEPIEEETPPPAPPLPPPTEATLIAIGDIMMHTPQLPGAYDEESGTYDFSNFFVQVRSRLTDADWAFANLETPIAGDERGFRGYPTFNAPAALADAMKDAGIDIVSTANNHTLDQGYNGLAHTLETLRERGLAAIGTADSEEKAEEITFIERNGIKTAFLAYTYGTNGIPVPKDKPYAVSLIEDERIIRQIQLAREEGADVVAVSLHFGNEYQRMPSDEQKRLARLTIESGADLVIGHHPHVVQPYELYRVEEDDGRVREGLIMYSLGNFISNQFGDYKEYGAILEVTFRKTYNEDGTAETKIVSYDAIPTWVHKYVEKGKNRYRVVVLDDLAETGSDVLLSQRMVAQLIQKSEEMNKHLDQYAVEAGAEPAAPPKSETGEDNPSY